MSLCLEDTAQKCADCKTMKTRFKVALTLAVLALAVAALNRFFRWMNLPSDLWFALGLLGLMHLLVLVPSVVAVIWNPGLVRGTRGRRV
jgi:hypothetical protein